MRVRWWPATLALAIVLVASTSDAAGPDHAREIEARRAFVAGEYGKAIDLFAQLYAETLHPVYLRNLGRCHQKLRHPAQAIDFFRQYLSKGRSVSAEERDEIQGYITEMEQLQNRQERESERATTQERHDPQPPAAESGPALEIPPAPPPHPVVTVEVHPTPSPESPPFYTRWWFWSAVGVVVAAGATAVVLSRRTIVDEPPCPSTCMGP